MDNFKQDEESDGMTKKDRQEFEQYLVLCTDVQVLGVHEKEQTARRYDYARLALAEMRKRGI